MSGTSDTLGSILSLAAIGFFGCTLFLGRETTVYGVSNVAPAAMRSVTAQSLLFVTTPVGWLENKFGWRFGGRGDFEEFRGCIDNADDERDVKKCMRTHEKYLPTDYLTKVFQEEGELMVQPGNQCVIDRDPDAGPMQFSYLDETGQKVFTSYLPTQLVVHLQVKGTDKNLFTLANFDHVNFKNVFLLSDDGCDFIRDNDDTYQIGYYAARGIYVPEDHREEFFGDMMDD